MIELIVIGAGGFGRETLDVIEAINAVSPRYRVVGVVDDAPTTLALQRLEVRGYTYSGTVSDWISTPSPARYVIAVGSPAARSAIAARLSNRSGLTTLVHPSAVIGSAGSIGAGTIVCAGVQISTNVAIGRNVHVNPNATVGHDAVVSDYVSVNPGAIVSGDVVLAEGVLVGAGAVILQGLKVGERSIVGAAACVVRDVPPDSVAKGVPAR